MNNRLQSIFIALSVFALTFILSVQMASMFMMSIAMFALSVVFRAVGGKGGFICFLLGCGFLFSSIVSPIFNAMSQTPIVHNFGSFV